MSTFENTIIHNAYNYIAFKTLNEISNKFAFDIIINKNYKNSDTFLNIFNCKNIDDTQYDLTDPTILYFIGLYHKYITQNIESMEKYFLMAINLNYVDAMYSLGLYHNEIYNENCNLNDDIVNEKHDMLAKKYLLMANNLGHVKSMIMLADIHYADFEYKLYRKYLLMAIKHNSTEAMYNLGCHYNHMKKYALMEKYFLMVIEHDNDNDDDDDNDNNSNDSNYCCVNSTNLLANYYHSICEHEISNKYYLMVINSNLNDLLHIINFLNDCLNTFESHVCDQKLFNERLQNLEQIFIRLKTKFTNVEIYILLSNIKNKNNVVINTLNIFNKKDDVQNYIYHHNYNYSIKNNIVDKCYICYNNNIYIKFENCTHGSCIECYGKIKICPFCRENL